MKKLNAFLAFRRMMTPWIIQGVFWVSVLLCILTGFKEMVTGRSGIIFGLLAILGGIVLTRVIAEIFMVTFRINETLTDIKNLVEEKLKQ